MTAALDASPAAPEPPAEALAHAREAGLRYVTPQEPGFRRERRGKNWAFIDANGQEIRDEATLARIRKLAIPPAYEQVWICADPRGHLQCTGIDARGRRQYRYHASWREQRDGAKFARMAEFGAALPKLHAQLHRDLGLPGLPQRKVLAVVVALLDRTLARVGNDEYARTNKSYGLTTLRERHVKFIRDRRALMSFRGKGGLQHDITIDDARLVRILRRCHALPGQRLFQYTGDDGAQHPIDSGQVNDYLAEAMGADFTAKDFRTWGATERALALLCGTPLPEPPAKGALDGVIVATVKRVAADLRNTPAVCRKSYINPAVFEAWREGRLPALPDAAKQPRAAARAVLNFLRREARRSKRKR